MKIIILLFLIDHAELERTVERLHERCRSRGNFLIYVIDLSPHGVELLPEQLDQIVVLLQVLIRLASQALNQGYIVHRQYPNVQLRGWSLWPIFQGNRTCSSIKLYNFLYYISLFICTEESYSRGVIVEVCLVLAIIDNALFLPAAEGLLIFVSL